MSVTRHVQEDDVTSTLEQVENRLQSQLVGRVYNFRLLSRDRGLILQGQAGSYHDKQVAQHSVMQATTLPILTNEIEVSCHNHHLPLLTNTVRQKLEALGEANRQLADAYDATLEAWVRALDLRDQQTEGHSLRVTQVTLRLARALGYDGDALVQIGRGALLHDIGNLVIPDRILLKPGPLTRGEREIMQRHPVLAHDLLRPIEFLREALDIPYCHHEKWDGSGYPRGLRGEQIPLPARLFAVVDVCDALASDRPYRRGWPPEDVDAYIWKDQGNHFDPRVAELFLALPTSPF